MHQPLEKMQDDGKNNQDRKNKQRIYTRHSNIKKTTEKTEQLIKTHHEFPSEGILRLAIEGKRPGMKRMGLLDI